MELTGLWHLRCPCPAGPGAGSHPEGLPLVRSASSPGRRQLRRRAPRQPPLQPGRPTGVVPHTRPRFWCLHKNAQGISCPAEDGHSLPG